MGTADGRYASARVMRRVTAAFSSVWSCHRIADAVALCSPQVAAAAAAALSSSPCVVFLSL
jgi:hypothetical protein